MDHIYRLFDPNLPRCGPGSRASTQRALNIVLPHLPPTPRILDLGCGPGMQTLQLAETGTVVALDNHQPFLDEVERRAQLSGLSGRITTHCASMDALTFPRESFDLLWSEGAIYNIGFDRGLEVWRAFLKPGGVIAVSELCWFKPDPPEEARTFWQTAYPDMQTNEIREAAFPRLGYELLGCFQLPANDWWESYYIPLEVRMTILEPLWSKDHLGMALLKEVRMEMKLMREHPEACGYTFFVGRRL